MQGRTKTHPRPSWLVSRLSWLVPSSWALATSRSCDRGVKKLAGTTWRADTDILWWVYTGAVRPIMEYATTPWTTASNANKSKLTKSKLSRCEPLLAPWKQRPLRRWRKEQTWSHWNSEEHWQFLPGRTRSGDYLVIRCTSWVLQQTICWKDRASIIWPGTSGEHMKTFWIHRSMRKTSSVVETATRKISEPPSSWRYLSAPCWTTDTNTTDGPGSGDAWG